MVAQDGNKTISQDQQITDYGGWNKIEHRLFAHITMNWKGIPLEDYETVVQLIGAVRTDTGLKVKATLDLNEYEKGKKITDDHLNEVNLKRHKFHLEWNYTIKPK